MAKRCICCPIDHQPWAIVKEAHRRVVSRLWRWSILVALLASVVVFALPLMSGDTATTVRLTGAGAAAASSVTFEVSSQVGTGPVTDVGSPTRRAREYDDSVNLARASARLGGYGSAPRSVTGVGDDLCRVNSFVPATLVFMADGTTKPIADVRVGEIVVAADPVTGERGPRRVTDTVVGDGVKELVDIEIDGYVITATDRHPFWVDDEGRWVDAEDLRAGDVLLLASGDTVTVDAVRERTEIRRVHNLTVDGIHTYYVLAGSDPVLVHNCVQPGQAGAYDDLARASDTGDGLQIHHMPQRAQGFTSPGAGGSLVMTDAQHAGPGRSVSEEARC